MSAKSKNWKWKRTVRIHMFLEVDGERKEKDQILIKRRLNNKITLCMKCVSHACQISWRERWAEERRDDRNSGNFQLILFPENARIYRLRYWLLGCADSMRANKKIYATQQMLRNCNSLLKTDNSPLFDIRWLSCHRISIHEATWTAVKGHVPFLIERSPVKTSC